MGRPLVAKVLFTFFSENSPGRWAVLAKKGNFKKIYYKTFGTSGRPTQYVFTLSQDHSPPTEKVGLIIITSASFIASLAAALPNISLILILHLTNLLAWTKLTLPGVVERFKLKLFSRSWELDCH